MKLPTIRAFGEPVPINVLRIDIYVHPLYMAGLCSGLRASQDECKRFIKDRLETQMPGLTSKLDDHRVMWGLTFQPHPTFYSVREVDWTVVRVCHGTPNLSWSSDFRKGISRYLPINQLLKIVSKRNLFGEFKRFVGRS